MWGSLAGAFCDSGAWWLQQEAEQDEPWWGLSVRASVVIVS